MKGALALRKPIVQGAAAVIDTSSTNIANNAYTQLLTAAQMLKAVSAIVVTNSGSQPLQLARGAAAAETDTGIIIPPGGGQLELPVELVAGVRLSLKSLGAAQTSGIVTVSFFG